MYNLCAFWLKTEAVIITWNFINHLLEFEASVPSFPEEFGASVPLLDVGLSEEDGCPLLVARQ